MNPEEIRRTAKEKGPSGVETPLKGKDARWLRSILESLPVGVITLDRKWRITSFNRAAEDITGFLQGQVIGWPCYELFKTPVCRDDCPMERALTCSMAVYDREVTFVNRLHRQVTVLVNATPLYDANGTVIGGVETLRDVSALAWMKQELKQRGDYSNIVGKSGVMQDVFRRMEDVSKTNTTVLILGESGTGKELVARAIHFNSDRASMPFVSVNCSALPEGILESELFGHVKGSFTGAIKDKAGRFELANRGSLFLDEIGELTQAIQVKLLRVLEEREFQRVGDTRTLSVDIRLIAATNKDLHQEVKKGTFRDDLYYRLNVYPIDLPPLRDRTEDVPMLIHHFLEKFNHHMGKRIRGITGQAMDALFAYPWPGNVRELENAIEHAFVHTHKVLIQAEDLPKQIMNYSGYSEEIQPGARSEAMGDYERRLIFRTLEESHWRRGLASKRLGISPVTLWRKMKKYGIEPEA